MGEVINLRNYRKKKMRDEQAREAAGSRARSGRTRGQRERDKREAEATVSFLDERRLEKHGAAGGDEEEVS
jgi:hypothetical protein